MTLTLEELSTGTDHERVVFCRDPEAGYRAVIAVHSTVAGPAAGGTRFWTYAIMAVRAATTRRLTAAGGATSSGRYCATSSRSCVRRASPCATWAEPRGAVRSGLNARFAGWCRDSSPGPR